MVIGAKDVLVARSGEKSGTQVLAARLEDVDTQGVSPRDATPPPGSRPATACRSTASAIGGEQTGVVLRRPRGAGGRQRPRRARSGAEAREGLVLEERTRIFTCRSLWTTSSSKPPPTTSSSAIRSVIIPSVDDRAVADHPDRVGEVLRRVTDRPEHVELGEHDVVRVDRDRPLPDRDDRHRPALAGGGQRRPQRDLDARGVEGVLDALAAGELADPRDDVLLGGVDDDVGAELERLALARRRRPRRR